MSVAVLSRADSRLVSRIADYVTLTKPGIVTMVVFTTIAGFLFGTDGAVSLGRLLHTAVGTALAAAGGAALNMFLERDTDARMRRTENRPLPAGRLHSMEALGLGVTCAAAGIVDLALFVNPLAAVLATTTLFVYVGAYTPLKVRSSASILVGAVSGALPPLVGYAAAKGALAREAWILFGVLFFWQMPHFLALAWKYRDDYARAGIRVPPVDDPAGRVTSIQVLGYTVALLAMSVSPMFLGKSPAGFYLPAAAILGVAFAAFAVSFAARRTDVLARRLFLASITYLPAFLAVLLISKEFSS